MKVEKSDSPNKHAIESRHVMCCAETGRVIAVFYNDYDLDAIIALIQHRDELLAALKDARELVDDWGAYAPAYMQEKHDLAGDLDRLYSVIVKAEAQS